MLKWWSTISYLNVYCRNIILLILHQNTLIVLINFIILYCVACVTQRWHIGITVWRRRLKIISVTFFSGTTQASFLIFGTEHQYGELYRVRQFRICRMSTSCLTELRIFLILTNFSSHFSQEPHRPASWYLAQSISMQNSIV